MGTFGPHNVGNGSTQTHTASVVCMHFIFYDWTVTVQYIATYIKGVSTVPTLPPCIFFKMLCNPLAFILENMSINNIQLKYHKYIYF